MNRQVAFKLAANSYPNRTPFCRWISLRIDFLGGLFAAGLAAYLIYVPHQRVLPSDTGFSLTMASTHLHSYLYSIANSWLKSDSVA
jgi:hypothetical protein